MGFRLNDIEVPLVWPGDIFLISINSSEFLTGGRAGVTDFGMGFVVCHSSQRTIEGELAHVTGLSGQAKALFDSATNLRCETYSGPAEQIKSCTLNFSKAVRVTAGEPLGFAGGISDGVGGAVGNYTPGLDLNMVDTAFENYYVNRERLGGRFGMGYYFRYGVCVNEYFSEPFKTQIMDKVGRGFPTRLRDSDDEPCGTMSLGQAGTAAGIWILESKSGLRVQDISGFPSELLMNTITLGSSNLRPKTHLVMSTRVGSLSEDTSGRDKLVEFEFQNIGFNNRKFKEMLPNTIYCMSGELEEGPVNSVFFYVQLGVDGQSLKVQRQSSDCRGVAQGTRTFSAGTVPYSFVR